MKKLILGAILGMCMLQANAATIELSTINSGFYYDSGYHSPEDTGYVAIGSSDINTHNFFTFDLAGIDTSLVTGATFTVYTRQVFGELDFSLHEVTTSYSTLNAPYDDYSPTGQAIYQDLGDGLIFGTKSLADSDSRSYITITLNQNFLDVIKNSSGIFSFGGASSSGSDLVYAFHGSSFKPVNVLTLTTATPVPEADKVSMILFGLALVGAVSMKRRSEAYRNSYKY